MKELAKFIREFIENKGFLVFLSTITGKICGFLSTLIAVRLISSGEYGQITLIASVFAFFAPLTGLGSYQGLLRYGSLEKDSSQKEVLSRYVFSKGFSNHFLIISLYLIVSFFYIIKYNQIIPVIIAFGIGFIGFYFFNYIQTYYRIKDDNSTFSLLNISVNLAGLLLTLLLTYFYQTAGYLFAIALTPWVSLLFFKRHHWKRKFKIPPLNLKKFWKYSIHASVTYFLSDILFSLDFFFIGILLDDKSIAFYKVAAIIPMNLMFLPLTFMQTDFPKLTKNHKNKSYLIFYIKNYYKLFIPMGLGILLAGFFLKDILIPFIFGKEYSGNGWIFFILLCGVVGNMWMRNLYGNLIAAIGKAEWNTYTAIGAIICMSLFSLLLIPKYGITGAAVGMTLAFTFTGITGLLLFNRYLKRIS